MSYHVITLRVRKIGFCCEFAYYKATRFTPIEEVVAELGVHKRTVYVWRHRCRKGEAAVCGATCLLARSLLLANGLEVL